MNPKGHAETLVATRPGNTNALKSGAHSPRFIEARAAEIVQDFGIADELDEMGKIALWTLARQVAVVEFIDRDLSERGLTDRSGKERYLLQRRERHVRLVNEASDRVVEAQARSRTQRLIDSPDEIVGNEVDYVRALQMIGLGQDAGARVSERLSALKLLLDLGAAGTTRHYTPKRTSDPYSDDPEIGQEVAMLEEELERTKKQAHLARLRSHIDSVLLDV